jgi:acyl-CoA dehydrogenase
MTSSPAWMAEEHELYSDSIRRFFADELLPHRQRWRDQGIVDRSFWNQAGEVGILAASIPEEYGGAGGTKALDAITLLEQSRTGDTSWGFSVHNITTHYLLSYGTHEQKMRWLPSMATGELVAGIAMSEPGTGSDLQNVATSAVVDGDHYVVNGAKTFISNGQIADLILLVVRTAKDAGAHGVSLLMVDTRDLAGFRRGRNLEKLGLKGQDTSELFFGDVRVPVDNLIGGEPGLGFKQLMRQLPWERLMIGIMAVGACDYALELTVNYVRERKAFDKRLMDFQNTRFKLAEAKTKLEVTRSFVNDCIVKLEAGTLDAATASMAKWWGAEVQNDVMDECLQLHGGYGFMEEFPISQLYADARVQKIYGGTNEIMKELIARSLDV